MIHAAMCEGETRLCRELEKYDYVRFTFADLHGISRNVTSARRNVQDLIKHGLFIFNGCLGVGPLTQFVDHENLSDTRYGNVWFKPRPDTAHALPWAGNGKYKMGEVLCDVYHRDGRPLEHCPMQAAAEQIQRLGNMGYKILSSFEMEYTLLKEKTGEPAFEGRHIFSTLVQAGIEDYYLDLDNQLAPSGVELEFLHTEYGPGMLEVTTKPQWGMKAADNVFIFKEAAKEIALQKGYQATFMTRPQEDMGNNGAHFNFSIWSKDGKNLFDDTSDESGLSKFARHWIAGLLEHSGALTALCNPTVNCYRRLHCDWAPSHATWGISARLLSIRAKTYGQYGAYVENRIPSAVSNPYLVLAATIAAGLDGVERKLTCPQESTDPLAGKSLPSTLEEALEALQQDELICKAIGPGLITWFLKIKKEFEIALLPKFEPTVFDPDLLAKERALYSPLL